MNTSIIILESKPSNLFITKSITLSFNKNLNQHFKLSELHTTGTKFRQCSHKWSSTTLCLKFLLSALEARLRPAPEGQQGPIGPRVAPVCRLRLEPGPSPQPPWELVQDLPVSQEGHKISYSPDHHRSRLCENWRRAEPHKGTPP